MTALYIIACAENKMMCSQVCVSVRQGINGPVASKVSASISAREGGHKIQLGAVSAPRWHRWHPWHGTQLADSLSHTLCRTHTPAHAHLALPSKGAVEAGHPSRTLNRENEAAGEERVTRGEGKQKLVS